MGLFPAIYILACKSVFLLHFCDNVKPDAFNLRQFVFIIPRCKMKPWRKLLPANVFVHVFPSLKCRNWNFAEPCMPSKPKPERQSEERASLLLTLIVESANNFPAVRLWHGVSGILRWGNLQSFANDLSNPGQEGDSLFLAEVSCYIHKRHSSMQPLTNVSCYCFIFVPQVAAIVCCLGLDSSGYHDSTLPGCCCLFFFLFFLNASQESVRREADLSQLPHCVSSTVSRVSPLPNILSSITTD